MWDVDDQPPAPGDAVEVGPGVVMLLAPNANDWTFEGTNTWLVAGTDAAVLVDPGPDDPGHLDRIDALARDLGVRITDVLLTHHHGDHALAAGQVAERWQAAISPRVHAGIVPEGTTFDLGGRAMLRVHRTPGHTADGVCFALPDQRLLLTGDTVLARVNPFISHPDGTMADMLASTARLAHLVDDDWVLLPGHGPVVRDPSSYLHRRLADRRRRIDQVAEVLRSGVPREAVVDVVYAKVSGDRRRAAGSLVDAILHYLDQVESDPCGLDLHHPHLHTLDCRAEPGERGGTRDQSPTGPFCCDTRREVRAESHT